MRERTLKSLFDKIMWYGIYLFPLIAYGLLLLSLSSNGSSDYLTFESFMTDLGFSVGPITATFVDLFSDGGLLVFADMYGMFYYASYLVFVTILHVIFDVIVFIPRLFHNLLDTLERGDIIK